MLQDVRPFKKTQQQQKRPMEPMAFVHVHHALPDACMHQIAQVKLVPISCQAPIALLVDMIAPCEFYLRHE